MSLEFIVSSGVSIDHVVHRHLARDFVRHQRADLVQQAAEAGGAGFLLAQQRELVLDQRMIEYVNVGRHDGSFAKLHPMPSEDRAVAPDGERRIAIAQRVGEFPARRPRSAFEHAREGQLAVRRAAHARAARVRRAAPRSARAIRPRVRCPRPRRRGHRRRCAARGRRCRAADRRCGTRAGRSGHRVR